MDYAFIWVDDFNLFEATNVQKKQFKKLLQVLSEIKIKPIMAYGGYDSIILCNCDLPYRMYGVAQSVGYGETRPITPVGGGLPVNKYYFPPLHYRLAMADVTDILNRKGYFSTAEDLAGQKFINSICDCKQCRSIIKNSINGFLKYNEASDFTMRNGIKRNRPTTDASLIAATHFMYSKVKEWDAVENRSFDELKERLLDDYKEYCPELYFQLQEWCDIYG